MFYVTHYEKNPRVYRFSTWKLFSNGDKGFHYN